MNPRNVKFRFGEPDRKGFEMLFAEPFVEYRGMIFTQPLFDKAAIDWRLDEKSPEQVQREMNHTPLILYVGDIDTQRKWAEELKNSWRQRIESEFPAYRVSFNQDDNGKDVVVTFWVSPAELHSK